MKKIIWIASYPKSGNTWMRYLLGNYFYNQNNKFDSEIISNLKKFHLDDKLLKLNKSEDDFKKNPFSVSKYWIKSQENIEILNGNIIFLKTHNALININDNEFTNSNLSLAIIHIVRDPRDVLISYSKFRNLSLNKTVEHMISKNLIYVQNKYDSSDIEIIGSWGFNYNSWKNGIPKIPRIMIKYEDLVDDCLNTFSKVIKFLSEYMKFKINIELIQSSIELSKFENLKQYEQMNTFKENQGTEKFFRTGKYNNWKNELSKTQIKIIQDNLNLEMIELGYLK